MERPTDEVITSEAELHAFYSRTIGEVHRYASRLAGGSAAIAEDLAQDAYLRLVREIRAGRLERVEIGWLIVAVRNRYLDMIRSRAAEERRVRLVHSSKRDLDVVRRPSGADRGRAVCLGAVWRGRDRRAAVGRRRHRDHRDERTDRRAHSGSLLWRVTPGSPKTIDVAHLEVGSLVGLLSDGTAVEWLKTEADADAGALRFWSTDGQQIGELLDLPGPVQFVAYDVAALRQPDGLSLQLDLRSEHRGEVLGVVSWNQPTDLPVRYAPPQSVDAAEGSPPIIVPTGVDYRPATVSYDPGALDPTIVDGETGERWPLRVDGGATRVGVIDLHRRVDGSILAYEWLGTGSPATAGRLLVMLRPGNTGPEWVRSLAFNASCESWSALAETRAHVLVCGTVQTFEVPA
jgi:DNA-directed RNA polymerase specialized sigma24 family protein